MKYPALRITLPNKLIILENTRESRILLACAHVLLTLNIASVYLNVYPILGILLAVVVVLFEKQRKRPLAQDALRFTYGRILLNLLIVILVTIYTMLDSSIPEHGWWWIAGLLLLPLNAHDAYCMIKDGKLGLRLHEFMTPILKEGS